VGLVYAAAHPRVDDVLFEHDARQDKPSSISGDPLHADIEPDVDHAHARAIYRDCADNIKREVRQAHELCPDRALDQREHLRHVVGRVERDGDTQENLKRGLWCVVVSGDDDDRTVVALEL
jgi:hypothetical protein